MGYAGVFFCNILDSVELNLFGCVWVLGERNIVFEGKNVHFSGFAAQNRSGEIAILGRIFHFYPVNSQKVFDTDTMIWLYISVY